jgi:ubiquinol-cytochrome c reductase cytochrome c subunit
MMKPTAAVVLACSILASSLLLDPKAGSTAPSGPSEPTTSEPTRGHALFVAQGCYLCHGSVGQGAPSVGASLTPLRFDDAGFRRYVRAPSGSMPRYDALVLPDTDLAAIAAYLRSLPAPKRADAIALLASYAQKSDKQGPAAPQAKLQLASDSSGDTETGRALYAQNCAGCHGSNREGGAGPNLQAEGKKRDVAAVMRLLAAPPPGMPKLVPNPVSAKNAQAIARFVTSP